MSTSAISFTTLVILGMLARTASAPGADPRGEDAAVSLAVRATSPTYAQALASRLDTAVASAPGPSPTAAPRPEVARRIDAAQLAQVGREPIDSYDLMPIGPEALVPPPMQGR